ncbi:MAG: ABC transporter permease subunit [Candidatus Nanopelagicales bacterium]
MKLLLSELRMRRVSLVVWALSVAALVLMIVAFYPQVRDDPSLNAIYENLSPSMQALLGGSDLTSPTGYLNTQLFAFLLPAVLLVFGVGRGAASIAGEEEEHTLDLLLAQPVARWAVYLAKAAALVVGLTLLGLAGWVPVAALNSAVRFDLPAANIAAVTVQMTLMCLALSLAAQAIAAWVGRRSIGIAIVSGYAFVSYVIYGLAGTVGWLEHLRPLTLWRWYLLNDPLSNGFGAAECLVLLATCGAAAGLGGLLFVRRDLHG